MIRRRARLWLAAALLASGIAPACESFETTPAGDAQDAGAESSLPDAPSATNDAGSDEAAPSDAATTFDAGTNAIFFDGFENGFACTNWSPEDGTPASSNVPRTGAHSCQMCATINGTAHLYRSLPDAAAGAYQFEAWIRRQAGSDAGAAGVSIQFFDVNNNAIGSLRSTTKALSENWDKHEVSLSATAPAARVQFVVHNVAGGVGDCILFDDAVLRFVPQ